MSKKTLSVLGLLLLSVAQGAMAQTDAEGRKVKRITFDREQVNIEFADGTTQTGVQKATVVNEDQTTGMKAVNPAGKTAHRAWYTTDGRLLQGEPRQKGVYVVREQNGIKKTIKK
ncbi:MAG: hypothetical protein IKR50_07040 [Prevotella sp.]|jgi:hypothetical protein|nr:hypothetical protein [Prevotella sp.]